MLAGVAGIKAPIGPSNPAGTGGNIDDPFAPGVAAAAIKTQAGDYDKIMQNYRDLLKDNMNPNMMTPITPKLTTYSQSPELSSALSRFSEYANTGGLSNDEVSNMRARAVSPIRSVYSSAQRGLDRQKAVQGGYAPGFGAASTRMAREMSEQLGQANTNVEASLAELRSKNRLGAMSSYAPLVGEQERMRLGIESGNTDAINRAAELNRQTQSDAINRRLSTIEGMRGLFGTAPGMASVFGNQVLTARELAQRKEQANSDSSNNDTNLALSLLSDYGRVPSLGYGGRNGIFG